MLPRSGLSRSPPALSCLSLDLLLDRPPWDRLLLRLLRDLCLFLDLLLLRDFRDSLENSELTEGDFDLDLRLVDLPLLFFDLPELRLRFGESSLSLFSFFLRLRDLALGERLFLSVSCVDSGERDIVSVGGLAAPSGIAGLTSPRGLAGLSFPCFRLLRCLWWCLRCLRSPWCGPRFRRLSRSLLLPRLLRCPLSFLPPWWLLLCRLLLEEERPRFSCLRLGDRLSSPRDLDLSGLERSEDTSVGLDVVEETTGERSSASFPAACSVL